MELCAVIGHISPMALYRLVCALGQQSLVGVLTRCGLPLPVYFLADEKHSYCLTDKVYLPTIVTGRVIWHLGYTTEASAAAFTQSYRAFQHASSQQEPSYRVRGILTDGFDSTTQRMRTLFPAARLGNCSATLFTPRETTSIAPRSAKPSRSSHLAAQSTTAEGLTGVCARPAVTPLRRPRGAQRRGGQRGARAALDSGEESGVVCGA